MGLTGLSEDDGPDEAEQARAWPALETEPLDGWTLRFSHGVTRRANSVLPVRVPDDVGSAVAEAERRYRARGLVPTFQVGRSAQPADLGERLARRGYREVSPTRVLQARAGEVLAHEAHAGRDAMVVTAAARPEEEWFTAWAALDGPPSRPEADVAAAVMAGVPSRYLAARADPDGPPVGVLRATPVGASLSLACLAVDPSSRRRGVARALVLEAVRARPPGTPVWLQVLATNTAAARLYAGLGFQDVGGYAYLVAPEP